MEGILKFNLPEEEELFQLCQKGLEWNTTVRELDEFLRSAIKHGHSYKTADEALVAVRRYLHSTVESRQLFLF